MLITEKPVFEQKLYTMLYNAYMTQYNSDPTLGSINIQIENKMKDAANKFALKASPAVADAVYNFVKEIGITITVKGTIISPILPNIPGGPCTGVISSQNINIT